MPTYNPNDFYPRTGQEVKSDGTTVNEADGIDTDNSRFVKGKVLGPTLVATIPYSSFTASTSYSNYFFGSLSRNAKKRTLIISNQLNQSISSASFYATDSIASTKGNSTISTTISAPSVNTQVIVVSDTTALIGGSFDSFGVSLGMGATAPTSGNVYIYVTEVF